LLMGGEDLRPGDVDVESTIVVVMPIFPSLPHRTLKNDGAIG
jgi:hypothetical protein